MANFYETRPLITKILLKRAARKAELTDEERKSLADIIANRDHLKVAGEVLDDFEEDPVSVPGVVSAGQPVGKLGDGTLLKLLIDNLPAIIAAIKEILAMFGV